MSHGCYCATCNTKRRKIRNPWQSPTLAWAILGTAIAAVAFVLACTEPA